MSTLFLFLLLVKHSICDLALQSRFVNKQGDKKNLTDLKGYLHAGDHAIGTFVVALLFAGLIPALGIAIADFVLHFIIDFAKRRYTLAKNIKQSDSKFWIIQSIDQIAHYSCYFVFVIILI
jgi:hypothetical protein|tara:strand:+ start:259 stop:621 length:363 start_codon:yes stop_codon:yes gene_type:complete